MSAHIRNVWNRQKSNANAMDKPESGSALVTKADSMLQDIDWHSFLKIHKRDEFVLSSTSAFSIGMIQKA